MKDKKIVIYQLLSVALLVALIHTVAVQRRICNETVVKIAQLNKMESEVNKINEAVKEEKTDATTTATPQAAPNTTTAMPQEAPNTTTATPQAGWRKIAPKELKDNSVELIAHINGILAMGNKDEHNAMTIGWGAFGVLWSKPIYTVYVSSSRFSHSLMEKNDMFTVSFFNKSHKGDVMYLGHHSGRDGDKISKTHFHLNYTERGNPVFEEAFLILECRKIYSAPFDYDKIDKDCRKMYDVGRMGIHTEYVGEIVNVYVNDANR